MTDDLESLLTKILSRPIKPVEMVEGPDISHSAYYARRKYLETKYDAIMKIIIKLYRDRLSKYLGTGRSTSIHKLILRMRSAEPDGSTKALCDYLITLYTINSRISELDFLMSKKIIYHDIKILD